MKTIRTTTGPFAERPYFEPAEIDQVCADELRKSGLYPSTPEAVRIDRFIEKRFSVVPEYEDLPPGVLGYTKFGGNGVERIVVSRELAEDESDAARRRVRATLAHEAGHGLLHAYLFALATPAAPLFGHENCSGNQVLCREVLLDKPSANGVKPLWSEFQANRAIGGILLPTTLVRAALKPFMVAVGELGGSVLDPSRISEAERLLTSTFDVNPVVARIRLDSLYGAEKGGQMLL